MKFLLVLLLSFLAATSFAAEAPQEISKIEVVRIQELTELYKKNYSNKTELKILKEKTLALGAKSVPVLIQVMKDGAFPETNRWIATFMLGQVMGEKSAPFIAKFVAHPHWMMRLASLKTLLALNQKKYIAHYAQALQDKSLLVRYQALENVDHFKIKELGPNVWRMMYDRENYSGKEGKLKRAAIIKNVIRTLGDLEFKAAKAPMMKMAQNSKFKDIHEDLNYTLAKLKN